MNAFKLESYTLNKPVNREIFIQALKLNRKMNRMPDTQFTLMNETEHQLCYNRKHSIPFLLKPFIQKKFTLQNEIINLKTPNQISISSFPANKDEIPFMRTDTVYYFSDTNFRVEVNIEFQLFKNKQLPGLILSGIKKMAKNKGSVVRRLELETYYALKNMNF